MCISLTEQSVLLSSGAEQQHTMPWLSSVGGSVPVVLLGMEARRTRDKRGRDR